MDNFFYSLDKLEAKEPVKGVKVRAVSLENTMITHMEFEPYSIIPEHSHRNEQITIILEGKMDMIVGNQRKTMAKGDAVAIPPNIPHSAQSLDVTTIVVDAWYPCREDYK